MLVQILYLAAAGLMGYFFHFTKIEERRKVPSLQDKMIWIWLIGLAYNIGVAVLLFIFAVFLWYIIYRKIITTLFYFIA